jgi:4-amino-4-deoxy-L-arabinose transferase-like glycosyltransferase
VSRRAALPAKAAARRTAARTAAVGGAPDFALDPRAARLALLAITLIAALLRLARPGLSPPGLNQDEALGGWISWCLLKTGHDMNGQPWPIFYSHGIGDFPSTLFFYVTLPFQALGGLSVWTTRLPAMVSGILCVPLIGFVGSRMFGPLTGLVAAAMLAFNPWHLFLSRFGVGAIEGPLFALLAVALLLVARLPLSDAAEPPPRPAWAALAGLSAGIACYGFQPLRLYFPWLFAALVLANPAAWRRVAASRAGRAALIALALGFAVPFAPLAIRHLVDPAIAHRWEMTRLWEPGTSLPKIVLLVLQRYVQHFRPRFLFEHGDYYAITNPLGRGAFEWYVLPCMLAGAALLIARLRSHASARALLALLAVYPAGDLISRYQGVHALRSAPGVAALVLLAAFGATGVAQMLRRRGRAWAATWTLALLLAGVVTVSGNLVRYFGAMNREPEIYHGYHADLLEATRWLKPRLANYDAVFCTTIGMNEPFAVTLVGLDYDPRRWFAEPRDWTTLAGWDVCLRYGKMRFMYEKRWVPDYQRLAADGRPERALFIVRPGELRLTNPVYVVRRPDGREVLWLCEERI